MAKDKKSKTEIKCKACKEKVKKKMAKKFSKVVATASIMLLLCGCSTSGSQPAKSQTATFEDCVFNIVFPTNTNPESVTLEIGTQAQYLESSGAETYSPSAAPTTSPTNTLSVPSGLLGLGGL